jgi:hypothetical protein
LILTISKEKIERRKKETMILETIALTARAYVKKTK